MKSKFNKAREEAVDAETKVESGNESEEQVEQPNPKDLIEKVKQDPMVPERFKSFVNFAREQGIPDLQIFQAITTATTKSQESQEFEQKKKAKNRKNTKGAFGGKQKSPK